MKFRSIEWVDRNKKLEQFHFFKSLDDKMLEDRVVFNCKAYNNIDLMFYKDATAYFAYPNTNNPTSHLFKMAMPANIPTNKVHFSESAWCT